MYKILRFPFFTKVLSLSVSILICPLFFPIQQQPALEQKYSSFKYSALEKKTQKYFHFVYHLLLTTNILLALHTEMLPLLFLQCYNF